MALLVAAATALVALLPASALATFPGRNGKIAFVRNGDIWAINADGSGLQQITTNPAPDMSPAWNADGTQIVFTRFRNGNWDVYRYVVDGPNPPVQVTNTDVDEFEPTWSPDGRQLAFARWDYMYFGLFIANTDGSDDHRVGSAPGSNPDWSPDGSAIVADSQGDTGWLSLINPRTGDLRQFPGTELSLGSTGIYISPTWSPSGQRVAYYTVLDDGDTTLPPCFPVSQPDSVYRCGIVVANLDGRRPTRIPVSLQEGASDQTWSPDGARIAFEQGGLIKVVPIAGGTSIPVTRTGVSSTEPAWQPLKQLNPAPSVSSLSPASVALGSGAITLIVNGSGFVAGSTVRLNGEDRPTTFVSASRLLAEIPASDLDVAGEARVTVSSPSPGGGVSGSRVLTIQGPAAVSPPRVLAPPAVSGSPRVGELLSCSTGTWSNAPTGFAFAWLRMGVPIPGANVAGHQVVAADAARGLACRVEATNAGGTSSAVSDEVLVAAELPAVTPPVVTPPVIVAGGATVTPPTTPPPIVVKRKTGLIGVGAPSVGRRGSPLRLTATFSGVPAGRVVLQRRVKGRFVNVSSLLATSSRVTLVFTPRRTGLQLLRVRYASAGVQRVSRTIVIRVRPPL